MKLDNLKMFPENRLKSLFGLDAEVLAEVIIRVLPVLEQNREQRLLTNPERKRSFVKAANRRISQERIYVEHRIRRVKSYRVVRDEFRLAQEIFPTVVSAVVGLIQFADLMN